MKVRSERKREALYIRCVYMPTDSTRIYVVDSCYERLNSLFTVVNKILISYIR